MQALSGQSLSGQSQKKWTVWHLRRGMDRRFRAGHPWIYSNEITESPKGLELGGGVELRDPSGKFLARGAGNPNSLIAFRALSRESESRDLFSSEFLGRQMAKANRLRARLGMAKLSHRLLFGEADGIPGLVVDRYLLSSQKQVFVAQAHTAGAQRFVPVLLEALEKFVKEVQALDWNETGVVLRNDLSVRTLEGLIEEEPLVLKELSGVDLRNASIQVASVLDLEPIAFEVDLLRGQKTGFFLDQFANIQLAALRFKTLGFRKIRILDLCCYVGQWGVQLGRVFKQQGIPVEVVLVDASANSLGYAQQNLKAQGVPGEAVKADVIHDLAQFSDQSFEIVISDPPALIKSRKDIPVGTHAYLQLATQVFRLVKPDGGIVSCSCSALLDEESFLQVLAKAAKRNPAMTAQWVARGTQSPDHPLLAEFPEGRYLKAWMGIATRN